MNYRHPITVKNPLYLPRAFQNLYNDKRAVVAKEGSVRSGGFYGRFSRGSHPKELKFFDSSLGLSAVDQTAEVGSFLLQITTGDTESTRDSRWITIKSIQVNGSATFAPAAGATGVAIVDLWCIQDTQANGAMPVFTDIFDNANCRQAFREIQYAQRFKVLKHWVLTFNPAAGATTAYNNVIRPISWYKKCAIPIQYNSTAGAITEMPGNNIFFAAGSTTADDTVTITASVRFRFQD